MEFVFTEEQAMIGETARAFFAESATSEHTRKAMAGDGIDRALWQSFCGELGLGGVALPEAYGGAGLGMVEFALVAEAAGAQVAAIPLVGSIAMAAHAIAAGGSDSQREEILPRLISGDLIGACAGTEMLTVDGNTLSGIVDFVAHGAAADLFVLGDAEIGADGVVFFHDVCVVTIFLQTNILPQFCDNFYTKNKIVTKVVTNFKSE